MPLRFQDVTCVMCLAVKSRLERHITKHAWHGLEYFKIYYHFQNTYPLIVTILLRSCTWYMYSHYT